MGVYFLRLIFLLAFLIHCSPFQTLEGIHVEIDQQASSSEEDLDLSSSYILFADDNSLVDKWTQYYSKGVGKASMISYLERSARYVPMMKSVLKRNRIPEDLVYVALIESGFSAKAVSSAQAVGYWQFIASTGRQYGLQINNLVDERQDPFQSTQAAAQYLKNLYSLFGDWYLALAAYNAGEKRINRVVFQNYNRNFWYLASERKIPAETINYIPKIIAAIRIANNPSEYGFSNLKYQKPIAYDRVRFEESVKLSELAQRLKISVKDLKTLNPKYKTDLVPLTKEGEVIVRIPSGSFNER